MTIDLAGRFDRVQIIKELASQGVYKGVFRTVLLRMEGTLHTGGSVLCARLVDWTKRRKCPERKNTSLLPPSTTYHLKCNLYCSFPFICCEIQMSVSSVFPRFLPGAYYMCSYCMCGCIHFCDIHERYLTSFVYSYCICGILLKYMLNIFNLAYYMHSYYI